MKIYFATRIRGFFRQLFNCSKINATFIWNEHSVYETNSIITKLKNKLGRSNLFDTLGIIQAIKPPKTDCEVYGSFNRFLKVKRPYFIYVENPTALFHYRLNRNKGLGKKRIENYLNDANLKFLIFMSRACGETFERVCSTIPSHIKSSIIYPYVPLNSNISVDSIKEKNSKETLKLLYVAQGQRFFSKGALEVIEAFKTLKKENLKISLHIITSLKDIETKVVESIRNMEGIIIDDFKFSFSEMQQIYAQNHIYLQPTSDDSFNLTILEALKSGLPVIASKLYAIPEMVEDGKNGYLCDPHYWFFDENNIPNPEVWNNRKKTIYSKQISLEITQFLIDKIRLLYYNRNLLMDLSVNSFHKAQNPPFSEKYIVGQWNELLKKL